MFGLLKFLFYTFVAVVVGVVLGTVPFGGRTIADRVAAFYQSGSTLDAPVKKPVSTSPKALARAAPRAKAPATPAPTAGPAPSASHPALERPTISLHGPITAGAANSPDKASDDDKVALDKLIAAKTRAR